MNPFPLLAWLAALLLLGSGAACAAPFTPPNEAAIAQARAEGDLSVRLRKISALFLGAPYARDPLGEGEPPDADPRFRLDRFDCLTFVETMWALASADDLAAAPARLDAIRYGSLPPRYDRRLHLPWLQWLPAQFSRGWLHNLSRELAPEAVREESKRMDTPEECRGETRRLCLALRERFPLGPVRHAYLPLAWARSHQEAFPAGCLMFVVLTDRPALPYRLHHVGLLVKDAQGRLFFRHASRRHGRVMDAPLADYLTMLATKSRNWPVAGVMILGFNATR